MGKLLGMEGNKGADALTPGGVACVELLEQVLAEAKAGKVTTCAIVACGPSDFGTAHAGPDAPRLNLGLDQLKATILARTAGPPTTGRRPSIIHR